MKTAADRLLDQADPYRGYKITTVAIRPSIMKRLKLAKIILETTQTEIINRALSEFLKKNDLEFKRTLLREMKEGAEDDESYSD